jgi:hypothetical protein
MSCGCRQTLGMLHNAAGIVRAPLPSRVLWLDASSHDRVALHLRLALPWTQHQSRDMARVLCVAEKPSIAKAVANHLGGQARAVRICTIDLFGMSTDCQQENVRGIQWVKNYKFDFRFQQWGQCSVTFTCVAGHIVAQDFHERFRKWHSCQPADLFEAPIQSSIAEVRLPLVLICSTY